MPPRCAAVLDRCFLCSRGACCVRRLWVVYGGRASDSSGSGACPHLAHVASLLLAPHKAAQVAGAVLSAPPFSAAQVAELRAMLVSARARRQLLGGVWYACSRA